MANFQDVKNSVYNPVFYRAVSEQPLRKSVRYYLFLTLILSAVFTAVFAFSHYKNISNFFSETTVQSISGEFPNDLEIKIQNGTASANVSKEPYAIKMPKEISNILAFDGKPNSNIPHNLLIIDTKANIADIDRLAIMDTVAVLTKNYLVTLGENGQFEIRNLKDFPNTIINKAGVDKWSSRVMPFIKTIPALSVVAVFLGNLLFYISMLVILIIDALLLILAARMKSIKLRFRESYKIILYASTLPLFIQFIFIASGTPMPAFLFSLILLVIATINLDPKLFAPTQQEIISEPK